MFHGNLVCTKMHVNKINYKINLHACLVCRSLAAPILQNHHQNTRGLAAGRSDETTSTQDEVQHLKGDIY